jgi:hypothetical protein
MVRGGITQHHLANRRFSGYDDIVDACSAAWNESIADTQRVIKMCSRDWLEVGETECGLVLQH